MGVFDKDYNPLAPGQPFSPSINPLAPGQPFSPSINPSPVNFQSVNQQTAQPGAAPAQPPMQGGAGDYLAQQRQMLSQYQQMAQKMYPQNPLFGNDSFAQNHPRIAGAIGNAFLTVGNMKPSRTPGEAISSVAGGLIGAERWHQQQAIDQTMFPAAMADKNMAFQKNLADIQELNARSAYYGNQSALDQSRINKNSDLMPHGDQKIDDQGHPWQEVFDPASGAITQKPVGWAAPEGYAPTFKNSEKNQRMSTPGGLQGEIISGLNSPDPAVRQQAETMRQQYIGLNSAVAGGKTGADQSAPHPQADATQFINTQKDGLFNDIQKPEQDYQKWWGEKVMAGDPIAQNDTAAQKAFQAEKDQYTSKITNRKQNFARYTQTQDVKNGVPFNPSKNYASPQSKAPAAKPKGHYNPTTGKYDL